MDASQRILADPLAIPLQAPGEALTGFGNTLVVAPHPDDESLACGGIIALLNARTGSDILRVLILTDGTGSHPHSRQFLAPARRKLRENETERALARLGCTDPRETVTFLGLPDGALPDAPGTPAFEQAAGEIARCLSAFAVRTVLVPWRRDPHRDHRAAFQLVTAAAASAACDAAPLRVIEYPVWIWERGEPDDAPRADETHAWRLDVSAVHEAKQAAIREHRSQLGLVIADDPTGFTLSPDMLEHFTRPWELFFESRHPLRA